ncbi:MAG: hypothetical protein SGPRY_013587 [Prymnesium sp.]
MCFPSPLLHSPGAFTALSTDGTPSLLLSFVQGEPADKIIRRGGAEPGKVLRSIGKAMAELHKLPFESSSSSPHLRKVEEGGACDLRLHLNGEMLSLLQTSEHTKEHEFMPFYIRQRELLLQAMAKSGIPHGILHGDPFLDNILCDSSGEVTGFVDLEDVAVGPCLFDIACCACACCFGESNSLDLLRLRALLEGYYSERPLLPEESDVFVDWMKATMLCNASWRFKNFNIDHREIEECRNAHIELQSRILELEQPQVVEQVNSLLGSL